MCTLDSKRRVYLLEGKHSGEIADTHLLILLRAQVLPEVIGEFIVEMSV